MRTITLTFTHPVFGTVTKKYEIVTCCHDLTVVTDGTNLATLTGAELRAMNGVPHVEVEPNFFQRLVSLFK